MTTTAHREDTIETVTTPEVQTIIVSNATAKNVILSRNKPSSYGMQPVETHAQSRKAYGRVSMRARLSRPSIECDIVTMNEAWWT
jgi:hypothetical protein